MPNSTDSSSRLLCREILAEAGGKAEEILSQARATAQSIRAQAETKSRQSRERELELAQVEARRRNKAILATVPVETRRLRLERLEVLLCRIRDEACERLGRLTGAELREAVLRVGVEALERMAADTFTLRVAPADESVLGHDVTVEMRRRAGRVSVVMEQVRDPALRAGEVVLEDGEGHQRWSLGPAARLERLWPELRRRIVARTGMGEMTSAEGEDP